MTPKEHLEELNERHMAENALRETNVKYIDGLVDKGLRVVWYAGSGSYLYVKDKTAWESTKNYWNFVNTLGKVYQHEIGIDPVILFEGTLKPKVLELLWDDVDIELLGGRSGEDTVCSIDLTWMVENRNENVIILKLPEGV